MRKRIFYLWLVAAMIVCGIGTASATNITYADFSSTAGLTLNGDAASTTTTDGDVLRLTKAVTSESGSAFSSTTINAGEFSTYFQFRITDPGGTLFDGNTETGADGLVFVVQAVSSSIGGSGGGIGYEGIPKSVGVEFDTWHNSDYGDPNSNHIGIDTVGSMASLSTINVTPRFDDGNKWHAWVDYNGTNLEVRANQTGIRPSDALLTYGINVSATLGGVTDAYVGFTSGTGLDWGNHDILYWEYRDDYNPISTPEPSTMLLLGIGILGLIGARSKT